MVAMLYQFCFTFRQVKKAVKYSTCAKARAAGVTPIVRSKDKTLYALNKALDRDKDGVACE